MLKVILLGMIFGLMSCAKSGGDGNSGTTPTGTTPPNSNTNPVLSISSSEYFFGVTNLNSIKSKSFTITNNGNKKTNPLLFSNLVTPFSIKNNNCAGAELSINSSCSFDIEYNSSLADGFYSELAISSSGLSTIKIKVSAVSNDLDELIGNNLGVSLLVYQDEKGAWNDGVAFDMGTTFFVSSSLLKSKEKLNHSLNLFAGFGDLSKTLNYLEKTDDDGNLIFNETTDADGILRNINFSSDLDLLISSWERTSPAGMKLKEVLPSFPFIVENLSQGKNSTSSNSFSHLNEFISSRRMTANEGSLMAQYSYILDKNRWLSFYGNSYVNSNENELVELALKDVYVLFDQLVKYNKNAEKQELSKAILLNFLSTSSEIFDETGIVLKYSSVEYNHSNFTNALIDEPLFTRTNTCRMNAYVLILVGMALENGNFDELNLLFNNSNLKQDLIASVRDNLWVNFKSYWIDDEFSENRGNCLPLASLVTQKLPISIVGAKNSQMIFEEMIGKANNYDYEPSSEGSVLIMTEAIEAISEAFR